MTVDNQNLFSQSYDQIVKNALGGGNKYFQMLGTPRTFSWPVPQTGQISPAAFQIMNSMPLWSPIGDYANTQTTFFSAYRQVLSHITYKVSPAKEQAVKDATDQQTEASNALDKAVSDENQAYITQKQQGGAVFAAQYPTINDWLADGAPGEAYKEGVAKATAQLMQAQDHLNELVESTLPTELSDSLKALVLPTGDPANDPSPRGWTKVPDGSGILRWQPDYTIGQSSGDWRAALSTGTQGAFTVTLDASDSTSNLDKSWAGGSASYGSWFWGVSGSGGWEKMNLTESDNSVTATITVKSSTVVDITPGVWFNSGFMANLAKGEGGDGYQITPPWVAKGSKNSLFGQFGLLGVGVASILVAYQPSFEVKMSSSTYSKYHEKFEAGGGIRIGPFHFGGHGGHESTYTHSTSSGTTFKGGSTSTEPLIIGVVVSFPGFGTP